MRLSRLRQRIALRQAQSAHPLSGWGRRHHHHSHFNWRVRVGELGWLSGVALTSVASVFGIPYIPAAAQGQHRLERQPKVNAKVKDLAKCSIKEVTQAARLSF